VPRSCSRCWPPGPRDAHEIASGLGGDHAAALAALARLQDAGPRSRRCRLADYQLSARGRRELRLQRRALLAELDNPA
jgi:DNA-binding transcriptional regulator PaaX